MKTIVHKFFTEHAPINFISRLSFIQYLKLIVLYSSALNTVFNFPPTISNLNKSDIILNFLSTFFDSPQPDTLTNGHTTTGQLITYFTTELRTRFKPKNSIDTYHALKYFNLI